MPARLQLRLTPRRRQKLRELVGLRVVGPSLCVLVTALVLAQLAAPATGMERNVRGQRALALREGFRTAIRMVHVGWIVNGRPSSVVLADGVSVAVNDAGWPVLGVTGQRDARELYLRLFPEATGRAIADGPETLVYDGVPLSYDAEAGLVR